MGRALLNPKHLLEYAVRHFGTHKKPSPSGWHNGECPFCGGVHKFGVKLRPGYYKCFKCGAKGYIGDLIKEREGIETEGELWAFVHSINIKAFSFSDYDLGVDEATGVRIADAKLPDGYKPILYGDSSLAKRARRYLQNRGFDLEELDSMGVGYVDEEAEVFTVDYFGYIILPFKRKGELYYFNARRFLPGGPRYKNPSTKDWGIGKSALLWNEDALRTQRRIFVMEGVFSALTAGEQGVALMGKQASQRQVQKLQDSNADEVVIALDAGCRQEVYELATLLMVTKTVKVIDLDEYADSLGMSEEEASNLDPNDIGKSALWALYEDAEPISAANVFSLLLGT